MWDIMNRNTKKVIWAIIIMVVPAFCLIGVSSVLMEKKGNPLVGMLDGKKIKWQDYKKEYDSVLFMAHMMYRENFERVSSYLDFNQNTWDRMLILKAIEDNNIQVSKQELVDFIQKFEAFKTGGQFDFQKYNDIISRGYRMPHTEFEAEMKTYLAIDKMKNLIADSAVFSEDEVLADYLKENKKRKVSYAIFKAADYLQAVEASDEEIKAYFDLHKGEFNEAAKIKVKYILQSYSSLAKDIQISDEEIQRYYDDNQNLYKQKDKVKPLAEVKDFIVKQLGDKKKEYLAEEKIKDIYYELEAGQALDDVAQKFQLTVQETDFFSKGDMLPRIGGFSDFTTIPFSLKIGEHSEPIKTTSGMAILVATDKKEAYAKKLEEVREAVVEKVKLVKASDVAKNKAEEAQKNLKEKIEKESFTIAEAAKIVKLEMQTTAEFTKTSGYEKGIMNFYNFREVSFSLPLNTVSSVLDDRDQFIILVPVFETFPEIKAFEAEKEALMVRFKRTKESEVLSDWIAQLRLKYRLEDFTEKEKSEKTK